VSQQLLRNNARVARIVKDDLSLQGVLRDDVIRNRFGYFSRLTAVYQCNLIRLEMLESLLELMIFLESHFGLDACTPEAER
jgi:hypothetical protein